MSNDEPKLTIFVSSMIGPLWDERVIVEEAIRTGIPLARAWVFERAPASSEEISESYLARVRECDIYLLILGEDISGPVKHEYQTAVECSKPKLCFVQEGVERTQALEEFLPTLQADVKHATFSDEVSLRHEVLRAVRQELVEGYKRYRLGEAERAQLVASIAALPPRPPDYFIGRREILDELKAGLVTGGAQAITALQGMGGIGKTATAQQLALEVEADFPGGVFWADLPRHGGDPSSVLLAWAKLCGHDVASLVAPQARAQAVRGMLGARLRDRGRLLAVLDDVREDWLEGTQTLKAALPPGVPLVVTTRDEELAHALGAKVRRLDALPMDDALALLSRLAGAEVMKAEPLEAHALAKRVGRLPLALELAGKLAARYARKPGWRLATLLAQVEAKASETLKLRGHPGLAATFAVSYDALKEKQQRLFRWLGVFAPGPITVAAVTQVLGDEEEATRVALDELVGLSLVEWGETAGVYRVHPLLAEYAWTLLEETEEERVARKAHLAYYLDYAKANAKRDPAVHDRLEAELANLMAAAEWAAEAEEHQVVGKLGAALYANSLFLEVRGYYQEAVKLLTWSVAAARETGDRRNEGAWLGNLANACRNLGQVERSIAYCIQALEIAREIGDRQMEGNSLGNLGSAYAALGQVKQAIKYHQQALVISREIGDRQMEGNVLSNLGNAYGDLGQVKQAIEYHTQALEIAREIGDLWGEGTRLGNLGIAYRNLGQVERAIEYYSQALEIAREISDRRGEGNHLGNLGIAYHSLGQVEKAIEYYQQALTISREIGDRRGEGTDLDNLGNAYGDLGQVKQAIGYCSQALEIACEIGNRRGEGTALGSLGNAYHSLGQMEKAIEYHTQALEIAREIGDRRGEGTALGSLGIAYHSLGQMEKAIEYQTQALEIAREIGDWQMEGNTLGNLGIAYRSLGQVEKAIEYYQQALDIARETGARRAEGIGLGNLGLAHYRLGQMKQAIEYYSQALEITQEIGDQWREGDLLGNLGNAYQSLGQVEKAIEHYLQALTISREIGNRRGEGIDLGNLGSAYTNLGEMEKAIEYYQQALEIAREIGGRENEGTWLGCLGGAYRKVGDITRARQCLSQALAIFEEIKSPYAEQARRQLAELD